MNPSHLFTVKLYNTSPPLESVPPARLASIPFFNDFTKFDLDQSFAFLLFSLEDPNLMHQELKNQNSCTRS